MCSHRRAKPAPAACSNAPQAATEAGARAVARPGCARGSCRRQGTIRNCFTAAPTIRARTRLRAWPSVNSPYGSMNSTASSGAAHPPRTDRGPCARVEWKCTALLITDRRLLQQNHWQPGRLQPPQHLPIGAAAASVIQHDQLVEMLAMMPDARLDDVDLVLDLRFTSNRFIRQSCNVRPPSNRRSPRRYAPSRKRLNAGSAYSQKRPARST